MIRYVSEIWLQFTDIWCCTDITFAGYFFPSVDKNFIIFIIIHNILSLGILVKAVTLSIDLTSLHDPLLVKQTKESISNCHKCISKMNVKVNGSWPWIQTFKSCWKTIFQLYTELAFYINFCLKFCSGKTITQWKYTQPELEKFLELFVKFCL